MIAPPQQERKPYLQVVCPQVHGVGFDGFRKWIKDGIGFATAGANGSWNGRNLVILFQEMVPCTTYETPHDAMAKEANIVQALLPKNVHVFFSAAQLDENGVPANMGWLVSDSEEKHQPKRELMVGDEGMILFSHMNAQFDRVRVMWLERTDHLKSNGKPFLSFRTDGGNEVECRICADAGSKPRNSAPDMIALVTGNGLPQYMIDELAGLRKIVVVNDDGEFLDGTLSGGLRYANKLRENDRLLVEKTSDFHSITLFE